MTQDKAEEPQQAGGVVQAGEERALPEKVSIWKKLLYHLWDADQHLKSPHVGS